jgi:hypothetical protein
LGSGPFSVGDFIEITSLAHQLYNYVYLVARGAPGELQLLNNEIGVLALALDLLIQEVKDKDSTLVRAGESRLRMVGEVMKAANATLKDLELFAKKYDFNSSTARKGNRIWDRVKFATEVKSIDALRARVTMHNTRMNLLLTSAGKSVVVRIALHFSDQLQFIFGTHREAQQSNASQHRQHPRPDWYPKAKRYS